MTRWAFLDVETTGLLDTDGTARTSKLLEVGVAVVEIPTFAVVSTSNWVFQHKRRAVAGKKNKFWWNTDEIYIHPNVQAMHEANGLWAACEKSFLNDYQKMDEFVSTYLVDQGCQGSPLCGANPSFDRAFLRQCLPETHGLFHYRNFEINTLWLLKSAITGDDSKRAKPASHRAVDDCLDSVAQIEQHVEFMQQFLKEAT